LLVGYRPAVRSANKDDRPKGEGVTGPFTRADLDEVAALVVSSWRSGVDRDWAAPAGTLSWTCAKTADHTVDAVLAVAVFLASRKQDGYPDWGWGEFTMGADPRPDNLVEALPTVTRILSAVIVAAEPGAAAVIWRRPRVMARPAADYAARGALELILHGHDVCAGLGVEFEPPAALSRRLRDHTRDWPHWSTPGWSALPATDDPWSDLLTSAGRRRTG
jgi:hypothetical protein